MIDPVFRFLLSGLRLALLAACFLLPSLRAQPVVGFPSSSITFAQPGRTHMDVGGTWNGAADVTATGDTFSVTYTNTGDAIAYDFQPYVTLPAGFLYVAGTAQVSTTDPLAPALAVTANQAGQLLTFTLTNPAGYDLPHGRSLTITYGLVTDFTVVSSTPQLVYNRDFSLTNGGPLVGPGVPGQQNVAIKAGDSIITINPKQQTRAVGETAVFTVTVTSTGLGGIFDVTIDESSINPGGNLQLLSITQTTPVTPVAVSIGGGSGLRLPYLPSDQTFVAEVEAVVIGCGNTVNTVSSVHRANQVAITDTANIQLNILQPVIAYNPPAVALDYNASVLVSFDIENTGAGVAKNFNLQSNLNTGGRTIALTPAAITAGWSYNPATGLFSNGADILPGDSLTLSYTVEITNPCAANGAGSVTYTPSYTNGCDLALSLPQRSHTFSAAPNTPGLSLSKDVSSSSIPYNSNGTYTLTLSAANYLNLAAGPVVVTDVLPDGVTYLGSSSAVGSIVPAGQTITWTLAVSDLAAARTLTIDFAVENNPCIAGETITNTASTSTVLTNRGCNLSANASVAFFVPTNPGPASSQSIGHTGSSPYETGVPDAAPLGVKNVTEGDVIPLQATYTFAPGYLGEWVGSTYTDNFGGVTQIALDPASVTVTGTFGTLAVPGGSVTLNASGFTIDLGFLAGGTFFNDPGVANRTFTLNYEVTAPDSAIASGSSRTVSHRAVLSLAEGLGGPTTCLVDSNNLFIQSTAYTIRRASAQIGLSFPAAIDICDFNELLTITVSNVNALQARNAFITLLNVGTDYDYDTSFAPVYGGVFNAGNITYTENGGDNPTFQFTGNPLTGSGTIQVRISRKPIPDTTPGSISARVDYDSWQTAPAAGRVYQNTTSYTPSSVRKATLNLTVSPVSIAVTSNRVGYGINVFNSDAGTGYGSIVTSTIPLGFTVNIADTDAANAYPVSVSAGPGGREVATWSVGDIASGGVRNLQLRLDVGAVPGCSVVIDPAIERLQATWGCDSEVFATTTATHPSFTFPNGRIQVLHDATQTVARLCSPGKILISVKNTGPTNVYFLEVQEIITDPSVIFIAAGPNPVRYRLNNGPLQNLASPTLGTGGVGDPYRWTPAQIPALGELVPVGAPGTNLVTIEIDLASTEDLAFTSPQMFASGEAVLTCGSPVISPAQPFTIPVEIPELTVAKTGRNESAGDIAFTETTYGGVDDVITWRLILTNNGKAPASNIRLSDQLSGAGGPAVINGPGLALDTPYTPDLVLALPDIAADGGTATYLITEILGGVCVNQSRDATVSWGCTAPGAGLHNTTNTPGDPMDGTSLVMTPSVVGGTTFVQTITSLPGGLAEVKVRMTNNGGTLYNPTITATIPGFALHDTTGPVTFGVPSSDITGVSRTGGTDSSPVFSFTGPGAPHLLRFGETIELTYIVRPTVFDTTQAETVADLFGVETAPALDPVAPAAADFIAFAQYTNSCLAGFDATDTTELGILRPDLDITAVGPNAGNTILTATASPDFTFTVTNNGPSGSIADRITLSLPNLGTGWTYNSATLTTPGTGGTGGVAALDGGVWTFTPAQVGTLAANQSALVTVNLTYDSTTSNGPLTLRLRARGESRTHDGVTITGDYSLDQRAQRVLGVEFLKERVSTSEPDASSSGNLVLIGEDTTFRTTVRFRGAEDTVSGIIIREQLRRGARTGNNDGNFGFVPSGPSPYVTLAQGTITSVASDVDSGFASTSALSRRLTFSLPDLSAIDTASGATTEYTLVARAMNLVAGGNNNNDNATRLVRAGLQFNYLGTTFHPPTANAHGGLDSTDLSSSGVPVAGLYDSESVSIRRPGDTQLGIVKTVRNVTRATAFAASTFGEAGDVIEYRVVVTNNASAGRPYHTLRITDTVPAKLDLSAADQGADTLAPPDTIDVPNTAGLSGLGQTITFNQANTPLAAAGQNFDRLDSGQSITVLYRGTLDAAVAPSETLSNTAAVVAFSIPVDDANLSVNQLALNGTAVAGNAATDPIRAAPRHYAAAAPAANVVIDNIVQDKVIDATSEPGSTSPLVFIGEQLRYRIALTLPLGTVPDLSVTDTLPAGLALVGTPAVVIGADLAPTTPGTLAINGQELSWAFGETIADGADRTITLEYVAQVRNVAGNTAGTALTNNAAYNFTGLPGDVVNLTQRTVTVAEPAVTVVHQVRNITRATAFAATAPADAGDILEYRVALTNPAAANRAPAYDLNFTDTLPAGLTYVPASTVTQVATGLTGTFVEPDLAGQVLTWGRTQAAPADLDLAIGANNFEFRYRATVDDTSAPLQVYTNALVADWTSLDGAPGADLGDPILAPGDALGERIGTGVAPNTYRSALATTTTALNATTITKTKAGDTLPVDVPASGFRVGDLITYTLTLPVQEGTFAAFTLADTLPAGLAFHDTVSITPATGDDGFTYVAPAAGTTAPELGDTGALAWNFGTLVNTGDNDLDNDELVVVYRVRVLPDAAPDGIAVTPVDQTLTNSATVAYTLADTTTFTSPVTQAAVIARQPVLTLAKAITSPAPDALGFIVRRPGDTAAYRITITNTGTAPAYNIGLTDTLPEGLRATAPAIVTATLNGAPVVLAPVWTEAAGTWVFALADADALLPGQTLVLDYTVTVDSDDTLRGATLTNTANIDAFHSLPASDPEAASRRTYALVGPATADLVVGLRIDGFVYHDIDLSDARDAGTEDWSGLKPTVFANLVAPNAGNPIVFRTVTVAPGVGDFAFDYLPPGDFTVILTDAAGNLVAQRPANWLNQNPANGAIPVTINQGTGDLVDQNLGLNQGPYALTVAPTIAKSHAGETIPEAGPQTAFRIGDLVTYTLDIFPHEGPNTAFTVTDTLPAGLAFHDTVSIAQLAGPARFTFVTPAGVNTPAAAAEGVIAWNFGNFTNAIADPANNTLRIVYRARVIDTGVAPLAAPAAAPASTTDDPLTNSAILGYANPGVSLDPIAAGPATTDLAVEQPRLVIAKALTAPALNRLPPNATGTFTVTVTNDGTAPAYNIRVTDTLPVGLRATAPVLTAATLNGVESLVALTAVATWNGGTGAYVFNLTDTQILLPGQELVLAYQFTVDDDAVRAATLTNSAVVNQYFSKPAASPDHRRQYAATDPATADIVVGLRIAGSVYHDINVNDAKGPGEDWSAPKPVVYVNLLDGAGDLYASATINPGPGAYEFTNLPADDYTLVFATTDTALVSDRPANWLYRNPNNGLIALPATSADTLDQHFGLYQDTLAAAQIAKTAAGQTIPEAGPETAFRIGDLVTYTIDIEPQEGVFTDFIVTDALPAGLAFVETVSIAQLAGPARFTYVEPAAPATAPAAAATGTLTWTFGNFANALLGPADNTLRIIYAARVVDAAGIAAPAVAPAPATVSRVNSARLDYTNAADEDLFTDPAATASIDVSQPRLAIAKTRLAPVANNLVMPGDTAQFRLTVTNDGDAPAYNVALADTLPAGMRVATPVVDAATLNGVDILGTLPAPAYDSGTGLWTLVLADNQPLLPGNQTFVIDYTVTVDAAATKGAVLENSALVAAYASKPSADAPERRVYDPTAPDTQAIVVAMSIDGSVYQQILANGLKDPTEDWTNGTPVFVNLVPNAPVNVGGFIFAANQVLRSVEVLAGDGEFTFTHVPPGDYRIVITNTAAAVAPVAPADWTFDAPAPPATALLGAITPVVMSNADLADQHLGLYRGRAISGQVYHDLAPYGAKGGGEDWTGGGEPTVYVNLVLTAPITIAGVDYAADDVWTSATVPAGTGEYEFTNVPPGPYRLVVAGSDTAITPAAPAGWVFVSPDNGARAFTVVDADFLDQDFGLTPGRTVSGHVYNDLIPNSVRDIGLEDWTGAPAVYLNLVRVSTNTVWASQPVNAGPGDFEFTDVIPGEFRLIVANAPGDTTAAPPSTWRFRAPLDGSRLIDVAAADIADQDFGLFRGRTVKGIVFRDDGSGGGTPNDGLRNGTEPGLGNVTVRLLSATATQLDIAQTDGAGNFTLRIPAETLAGATLILEELNPGGHRSTGATLGAHGDSYDRATDRLSFTYPDDDVDGFAFGDVPANQLLTDGAQTILPGAKATYRHTFIAGTGGSVVFSIDASASPADVPWSHVLHRDLDCDGEIDAGEPILLGAPITVTAGQEVCLLLVTHAPGGAPYGAVATARLEATFTYANAAPALDDDELVRQDVTTVGATASAGLELTKAVDKTAARPGEEITYTITYTNVGAETLRELFIYDTTPAYTVFVSASYGLTPASLTTEPIDAPAPDATGAIRWEFTGELEPGGTGTVIFSIRVRQ